MKQAAVLAALAMGLTVTGIFLPTCVWHSASLHLPVLALSSAWLLWRALCLDQAWAHGRAWRRSLPWMLTPAALSTLSGTAPQEGLALGKAFQWTAAHTQILETALAQDKALPVSTESRGGHPALHAVGQEAEEPLVIPWAELVGHVGMLGTTRSGKTRELEAMLSEAIRGTGAVVVVDPKGDRECLARCAAEAQRQGRTFSLFTPAFPQQSVCFNPLATATSAEEVSARIRVLLPSKGGATSGGASFFDEYALAVIETIAAVQEKLHEPWTLKSLYMHSNFRNALEHLLDRYLTHLGCGVPGKLPKRIQEYYKVGMTDLLAEALIEYVEKPRGDFSKVTAGLIPAFRGVVRGPLGRLLAPSPTALTWADIVEQEQVVYFALASMLIGDIANRIGRIVLQDLVGYLGAVYAYTDPTAMHPLTVLIDEFGDVVSPGFVNVLNKGGGAQARFIVAHQSLADTEAVVGREQTQRIFDNLNTQIYFRLRSDRTAQAVSDGAGMCTVQVAEKSMGLGVGGVGGLTGHPQQRITGKAMPLIRPEWLKALPRGEAFVQLKGELWKLRVPLLTPVSTAELASTGLTELWERMAPDTGQPFVWSDDDEGADVC